MGWSDTDETRHLEGDIGALFSAYWGVPLVEVQVRKYDGEEMSVGVSHPARWPEWKWSLDPTVWSESQVGIVFILQSALDHFTAMVVDKEEKRLSRLAQIGVYPKVQS